MERLKGRVAVITGAARGIGEADESSFVNGHALVVDGGLIGGRLWSEVQTRGAMLRSAMGVE